VILLAPWIARVFVSDPETIDLAIPFIRVGALATIGMGMDGSATGVLRGGGDTTWTFYATAAGMYLVALPLGIASVATGVGVLALYTALVAETVVPALIMLRRYAQGVWLQGAHTVSTGD
jgi:Na+-driven multidrug efflux pump